MQSKLLSYETFLECSMCIMKNLFQSFCLFSKHLSFLLYLFNGNVKSHQPHLNLAHFPLNTTRATQRFASYLCTRVFVCMCVPSELARCYTLQRAIYHSIFSAIIIKCVQVLLIAACDETTPRV